ncbi:MAG: hypothetical protein WA919_20320 [Coleofasciculaceae cyanobacterium]
MPTVFIASRLHKIEIDGTDMSSMVIDGGVSEDKVTQDGVVTKSGSLTLQYDGTEHLDPRENSKFVRGKKVALWMQNTSGELEKFATLYLTKDGAWDGAWTLKLDLTCILGYLSDRTAPDDKSGVCPGTATRKNTVIQKLLNEALTSVPGKCVRTSVPGILTTPPEKGNASYISLAGQIAFSEGYALKTDPDGCIFSGKIESNPTRTIAVIRTDTNAIEYTLQGSGELPPNRIQFQQTQKKLDKVPNSRTTISKRYGAAAEAGVTDSTADRTVLLEETTTVEVLNPGSRTRTRTTTVKRAKGLALPLFRAGEVGLYSESEKIVETHRYEKGGDDACKDGGQGRLISSLTEIWKQRGSPDALGEWYGLHRIEGTIVYYPDGNGGEAMYFSNPSDLILVERHLRTHKYLDQGGDGITIVGGSNEKQSQRKNLNTWTETRYYKLAGKLYPRAWKLSVNYTSSDVSLVVFAGVDREEWRRSFPDEWEKETTQTRALGESNSQAVDSQYQLYLQGKLSILDVRNAATRVGSGTIEREFGNSGQLNPPAADRFPAENEATEESTDRELRLRDYSGYELGKQSKRSISIPFLTPGGNVTTSSITTTVNDRGILPLNQNIPPLLDEEIVSTKGFPVSFGSAAQRIGNLVAALIWGRSKGAKISTDLRDWMFDLPIAPAVEVVEFDPISRTYKRYKYIVDGLTLAFDGKETKTEFDLIYLGRIGDPIPTTIFAAPSIVASTTLNISALATDLSIGTPIVVGSTVAVTTTAPVAPDTSAISVVALSAGISSGQSIVLDGQVFSVTASAIAGATAISVSAIAVVSREVPTGTTGRAGQTYFLADDAPAGSTALILSEPLATSTTSSTPIVFDTPGLTPPFLQEIDLDSYSIFTCELETPRASNEPLELESNLILVSELYSFPLLESNTISTSSLTEVEILQSNLIPSSVLDVFEAIILESSLISSSELDTFDATALDSYLISISELEPQTDLDSSAIFTSNLNPQVDLESNFIPIAELNLVDLLESNLVSSSELTDDFPRTNLDSSLISSSEFEEDDAAILFLLG